MKLIHFLNGLIFPKIPNNPYYFGYSTLIFFYNYGYLI